VRRYRLGEEPRDDLSLTTTVEERLEMVETLSVEAWTLTGRPFPSYARHEIPVTLRPLRRPEPGD
jgi:hypothetical protein